MKKYACLLVLLLGVLIYLTTRNNDPIDTLAAKLSKNTEWSNGTFPILNLPEKSTPEEVIQKCTKMFGFQNGHIKKYEIKELKEVEIYPEGKLRAAILDTDQGKKILLFKFIGTDWWSRFFDMK